MGWFEGENWFLVIEKYQEYNLYLFKKCLGMILCVVGYAVFSQGFRWCVCVNINVDVLIKELLVKTKSCELSYFRTVKVIKL